MLQRDRCARKKAPNTIGAFMRCRRGIELWKIILEYVVFSKSL